VPIYEFRCQTCGQPVELLLAHARLAEPRTCEACGGQLTRRWSRVGVDLAGWGFSRTDGLVPERPGRGGFREVRERAERFADGG
jgi:putative FmdB family regulatory protein